MIVIPIITNENIVSVAIATPSDLVVAVTIVKIINAIKAIDIAIAVAPIIFPTLKTLLTLIILDINNDTKKMPPVITNITGSHHICMKVVANENNQPKAKEVVTIYKI